MKKSDQPILSPRDLEAGGSRIGGAFRRNKYLWYAFLFPFVLTYLAYLTRGLYPIANRDILTIDLYHQYAPFLSELYEKLSGFDSLLYTWNAGMGLNFLALSAYYLISPFNLILLLFPRANLPEAIAFIQVLKIGLCSLTMAYYLRRKFGRDGIGLALFGSLYAMSTYVIAYSWNIMWLDGVLMLPVIALGLDEMIAGRRYIRYVVLLALTITFCYYISYFICLFLVIYFLISYFSMYPALRFGLLLRKGVKFAFFSALAGGLSAIVVLPTYTALQLTSAANDTMPSVWKLSFNLFDFLTNQMLVVPLHIRDGLPNIYCGLVMLLLIPLYFFSPTIPIRSKVAHIVGLMMVYFSFNINALDFIWNGMHYPNQLPYRYAFVYVFLVVSMGYPVFLRLKEFPARLILGVAMAAAAFVLLAEKLGAASADPLTVYLSVFFLSLLAAAFGYARNVRHPRELRITVLASVIIAEILVNTFVSVDLLDRTEYYSDRGGFVEDRVRLIDLMDRVEADGSGDFYRVELLEPRTVNDTILHSYRGVSVFASTAYLKTTQVMRALGLHNNGINSYRFSDSTPVVESILGIRYLVGKDAAYSRPTMETDRTDGEYTVFKNPYALPVAYMAGQNMDDWQLYDDNPFDVQNQFLQLSTGIDKVFLPLKTAVLTESNMTIQKTSSDSSYSYTKPGTGSCSATLTIDVPISREVSFYLDANQLDTTMVTIGDDETGARSYDLKRPYIVDLGFLDAGTVIQVQMTFKDATSGSIKLYAASLDEVRFKQAMKKLSDQGLDVETFSDTSIVGTIQVREAGTLFTSIPYDAGWTVKVDGNKVPASALADGLLSVELVTGEHRIEMEYLPPKLLLGALVTAGSLVVLAAVALVLGLIRRRRPPDEPLSGLWPPIPEWSEYDGEEEATDLDLLSPEHDDGRGADGWHATSRYRSLQAGEPGGRAGALQEKIRHITLPEITADEVETETGSVLPPQIPLNPVDDRFAPAASAPETGAGMSSRDRGPDDIPEHGVREDAAEQDGDQKQDDGESDQDEHGVERTL